MKWCKESKLMLVSNRGYKINKDMDGTTYIAYKPSGGNGASREDIGSFDNAKDAQEACDRHSQRMTRGRR